ncbi:putative oxidoreductase GLYR1 homolog isoform X1 [Acyrthosiphon pisum]|uniref:Cytokine-like nuclear factor N-PAC n=1 Tax=Acyrthosiphon pisum TaxID=7029 RepID=A0A8R2D263_ACYPI|nr:putative oxidoreductase GLYR1 homolog isoform X1 [Acyrthosiphon pisum]|eukprot:XP_016657812.1 PREDICTED: putative oxidoreductase GLYR1 homolog isoform X1 [Acyrthosiphon pisum]
MTGDWNYELNDLVWAKMKGFPPWPGRVSEPTVQLMKKPKKNCKCIFFFGTNNYAWIEVGCLKPYFQFKDTLTYSCKTTHFRDAVKAIEEHIEENGTEQRVNNGLSEADSRFENLVKNETPALQPERSVNSNIRNASTPLPEKAKKRHSKPVESTSNGPKKEKPKKPRLNNRAGGSEDNNTDILTNLGLMNNHTSPLRRNNTLLDRPEVTTPELPPLDITTISKALLAKNITPSPLKFGFLGLGNMGSGIVKNLLNSGHHVIIWNRSPDKCQKFVEAGAKVALTPSDVIGDADIIFSCVSDPQVAKDMVFGNCGVLPEINKTKGYVEMTGIDPETSQDICEAILSRGGRYLEAMIQGSKSDAEQGKLICLTAGDQPLFADCKSVFCAISDKSMYLGDVGAATKMNLILHSIKAVTLAGLAEGMALADRAMIPQQSLLEILGLTSLRCPLLAEKGEAMMMGNFQTHQALKHIQKDLNLSLNWSDVLEQPCPVTASVNEVFKHAKRLGYSDHDTSAFFKAYLAD